MRQEQLAMSAVGGWEVEAEALLGESECSEEPC